MMPLTQPSTDGHEVSPPAGGKKRTATVDADAAPRKQPRFVCCLFVVGLLFVCCWCMIFLVCFLLLLYFRVCDTNHNKAAEVESVVETEGGEEEDGNSKLTKCLAKWQDKSSIYPTLSSLLDRKDDLACIHLQVIHIYMEQGRATGDIILTDG